MVGSVGDVARVALGPRRLDHRRGDEAGVVAVHGARHDQHGPPATISARHDRLGVPDAPRNNRGRLEARIFVHDAVRISVDPCAAGEDEWTVADPLLNRGRRGQIGVRIRRREVDDRVGAVGCRTKNVEIAEIPEPRIGTDIGHGGRARSIAHERLDLVAFGDKRFDNSLSDVAAAACDEYTHADPLEVGS